MIDRTKLIERAKNAKRESRYLDFKGDFDPSSPAAWCEVVKDMVAFANSGGGVIVFGVANDGTNTGADMSSLLKLDIADITNRIHSYTEHQFADVEILEVKRGAKQRVAFVISGAVVPMIFVRPGTYDAGGGKQKTAFGRGTIYFRHGGKSEPGNRDDLIDWRDRELARVRTDWLSNIRKVVETPADHTVTVISAPLSESKESVSITAQISREPGAVRFVPRNAEEIWPYRRKDLLRVVNHELRAGTKVKEYDMVCINRNIDVLNKHPDFAYKPHTLASPQYSNSYAKWIVAQCKSDPNFLSRMRAEYKSHTAAPTK